jgi:hypothetical protein
LFFFRTALPIGRGDRQKAGNCGLFDKNNARPLPLAVCWNRVTDAPAVDKFFVFVGKSPENKAFAAMPVKGLSVFSDQNEEAYSFVVKPA